MNRSGRNTLEIPGAQHKIVEAEIAGQNQALLGSGMTMAGKPCARIHADQHGSHLEVRIHVEWLEPDAVAPGRSPFGCVPANQLRACLSTAEQRLWVQCSLRNIFARYIFLRGHGCRRGQQLTTDKLLTLENCIDSQQKLIRNI
jgi:hypothetical protein